MLHLKVYMHILEERTVCAKQSLFDTSAEEGGVKVWESNDCKPVLRPILARGARGLTHWGLTLNTLRSILSSPSPRLGDSPLESEGEQQDSSGASQWLTVSSKML